MIKLSQVYELLCKTGIPVTYGQFNGPKEDIPDPPYIAYYEARSKNFGADNVVYAEQLSIVAELYTSFCRDLALEKKIKQLLIEAGVFYDTNHADIQDNEVHIAYFEFTVNS